MVDNEPMSEERLAEIRNRHKRDLADMTPAQAAFDIHRLLAEVERLQSERATQQAAIESWYDKWLSRERTQQLLSENAAMREIVQAVAADHRWVVMPADDDRQYCMWCGGSWPTHQGFCPVTKAHDLLGVEASNGK